MENKSKNMEKNTNNMEQNLKTMEQTEQNSTLSKEAQAVIDKFIRSEDNIFDTENSLRLLIVFLYAKQPYAKKEVLEALQKYNNDLGNYLSSKQISILCQEYSDVIKYCAYNEEGILSRLMSMRDYDNIPNFIVELCVKMAAPTPGADILLANSGLAEFSLGYNSYKYYGYESSPEAWAWSQILIDAFNVNADLKNCDFDEFVGNAPKQYDFIFYSLPGFQRENEVFEELLSLAKCSLKENGQMYCRIPYSFTFRHNCEQYRKSLMEEPCEFEVKVISMPQIRGQMLFFRECVLCLEKNHTGKVTILDGKDSEFVEKYCDTSLNCPTCEVDSLLKALGENNGKFIWHGEASDLDKNCELTLVPYTSQYYQPTPTKDEKLMEIGELVDIVNCKRIHHSNEGKQYPTIKMKNLSTDYLRCNIEIGELENSSKGIDRLLSSDALLFGVRGELCVAKWSGNGNTIGLGIRIFPMRLKSKDVTEDFFLRALTLEETYQQVQLYTKRGNFIGISTEEFLKLEIIVPPLERQKEICLQESRASLSEADRKLLEEQKNFNQNIHRKIHSLGQTISNLRLSWEELKQARQEGNGIVDDNKTIGELHPISVTDIYSKLSDAIDEIERHYSTFDRSYGLVPEDFALTEFIEDYINHHRYTEFTYEYDSLSHHYNEAGSAMSHYQFFNYDREGNCIMQSDDNIILMKGDFIERVTFSRDALNDIFNDIIANARTHGFDRMDTGNKVKIELYSEGLNHIITISNNGKPLDPKLEEKDVLTYGLTSDKEYKHSGIGGYDIIDLMQKFGGNAEFISSPSDDFTVSFKLIFSKTNIIAGIKDGKLIPNERDFENVWDYIDLNDKDKKTKNLL